MKIFDPKQGIKTGKEPQIDQKSGGKNSLKVEKPGQAINDFRPKGWG